MSLKKISLWVVMLSVALICGTAWAEDKTAAPNGNQQSIATLTDEGPLVQPGTQILSGTNTYTGSFTISAGTLNIGSGGTTGLASGAGTDNNLHISGNITDEGPTLVVTSNSALDAPTQNGCQTVNNCRCHCRRWRWRCHR